MSAPKYPYASGELLKDRNTYFYSKYLGVPFLKSWQAQRAAVAGGLPPAKSRELARGGAVPDPETTPVDTTELLITLYSVVRDGHADANAKIWLDRLINKFEVTKRLHAAYGEGFRAVDPAEHRDLENYLLFCEVLECHHQNCCSLPALNALLKCMDTLCAYCGDLRREQQARLGHLIAREQAHVARLADRLEIADAIA